ncbi:hypothetical protein B7463_g7916, partial [Scytalidium lignicola]
MVERRSSRSQEDPASTSAANRKLRNRLSQRAFRARQSVYIKELEERLRWATKSESDLNTNLEESNKQLRLQLLDCHKKLESLQVTLKAISDSVATTVGIERSTGCNGDHSSDEQHKRNERKNNTEEHSDNEREQQPADNRMEITDPSLLDLVQDSSHVGIESPELLAFTEPNFPNNQTFPEFQCNTAKDLAEKEASAEGGWDAPTSNDVPEFQHVIDNTFDLSRLPSMTLQNTMGLSQYKNISSIGSFLLQEQESQLRNTNSLFSDHIAVCEHYLKLKWNRSAALLHREDNCLTTSVYFMLSTFICMSWPTMTSWHTYTKAHVPVAKLMRWKVDPTPEAFVGLSRSWQPTSLQLSVPHPAIIDWIPFPTLRDKLIRYHAANPRLDEIICKIGNSYVMETDVSRLVSGIGPTRGYISVWDLVRAISPEATDNRPEHALTDWNNLFNPEYSLDTETASEPTNAITKQSEDQYNALPVSNVEALFNSKVAALQAFKLLGMDKGASFFQLDRTFFEEHPELYDYTAADLIARGIPLRPSKRRSIPIPGQLDSSVLERYRELASWTFDLSLDRAFSDDSSSVII